MITAALLLSSLMGAQQDAPSASKIVSEVMAKYAAAKTVSGTITLTQSAGSEGGVLVTELALERPGRLFIQQIKDGPAPKKWLVTADGRRFSYEDPLNSTGIRLLETMKPASGQQLGLTDVYSASSRSIGDRSVPLDIAISRVDDLKFISYQWATLQYQGEIESQGEKYDVLIGDWRQYGEAKVSGKFRMVISKDRLLKQYSVEETYRIQNANVQVLSTWDVKLTLDASIPETKFKVVY